MLYRYELEFDGERQEIGFLQGMCELDLDDETSDELTRRLDSFLPFPSIPMKSTRSFFTEEGIKFFHDDIVNIINEYERQGVFDVTVGLLSETNLKDDDILYSDNFQIVVKDHIMEVVQWEKNMNQKS